MEKGKKLIILILLLVSGFVIRADGGLNQPIFLDEIRIGATALKVVDYGIFRYILIPKFMINDYTGPGMVYLVLISIFLFGKTALALKIPFLVLNTLSILFIYLFYKEFYNDCNFALLTAALFTFSFTDIYYLGIYPAAILSFFSSLLFYLVSKVYKTNNKIYLYLLVFTVSFSLLFRLSILWLILFIGIGIRVFLWPRFFKKIRNLTLEDWKIISYLFLFGIYPIIFYNLSNNFATYHFIKTSFPYNKAGINLLDIQTIKENLFRTLSFFSHQNLYYDVYQIIFSSLNLSLFVFSLIFLILYKKDKNFSKNYFLIFVLFFTIIPMNIFTFYFFSNVELCLITPIYITIIGRAFHIIATNARSYTKKLLIFLFLFFLLFEFFIDINFLNFAKASATNAMGREKCTDYVVQLNQFLNSTKYNQLWIDDAGVYFGLNWINFKNNTYIMQLSDEMNIRKGDLIVFSSSVCDISPKKINLKPSIFQYFKNKGIKFNLINEIFGRNNQTVFEIYQTS